MFRPNQKHLQSSLFGDVSNLTPKARKRLEESWAGAFYREFFFRLDESPFAVLFSDQASRPNIPVNVLVSLETLKAGSGWSDEEMHDAFLYNVQVRYALGYRNLGEGDFDLRTVYNFRHRLSAHMAETGENLIDRAFAQITDGQVRAFQLKTGRLRMDSFQVASNIQRMSRLQLLVEMLQRVHRMLSPADQDHYAEALAPYQKGSSGQYIYHLKGEQTGPHLQRIGELMHRLLEELAPAYASDPVYLLLARVFGEQFTVPDELPPSPENHPGGPSDPRGKTAGGAPTGDAGESGAGGAAISGLEPEEPMAVEPEVGVRPGQEISPSSLQSPDDPEASYRKKGSRSYQGYVGNLTESCDADNPFQLIVKVQAESNTTEDTTMLLDTLPELASRTDLHTLHTLHTDGGFCGPTVDEALRVLGIQQVPSAMRGSQPSADHPTLADCTLVCDDRGKPTQVTCPHGHAAEVKAGRKPGRYLVRWTDDPCPEGCFRPQGKGTTAPPKTVPTLRFSQAELDRALRRQRGRACHQSKQNLRAAVEATVGAIKRPFSDDQLPVRGKSRVTVMLIGSAAMVNIRRIQRHLAARAQGKRRATELQRAERGGHDDYPATLSFLLALWNHFRCCSRPVHGPRAVLTSSS